MALNVDKLRNKLKSFDSNQKTLEFSKLLWKPKEGESTIRIVPYRPNGVEQDSPFIELKFYYGLGGGNYLAPITYGKPDPIQEVIETLRSSGSQEEKTIADKLNATSRTYVPIIVRGEEDQGVRFWGFGVTVYKQLLELMTNSKWGDITSLSEGNDLDIKFTKEGKKKNAQGKSFPETSLTPDPRKSQVCAPSNKALMEGIRTQLDINKVFPLKSYDELKAIVEKWLNPEDDQNPSVADQEAAATTAAASQSETATATPATTEAAVEADFDAFFAKKK